MSATALEQLVARAGACGRIGLDTEFVGEGRYRTLLCLIQLVVCDDAGLEVLVVDALEEGASSSMPAARTSPCCGASPRPRSTPSSTRRSLRALPA